MTHATIVRRGTSYRMNQLVTGCRFTYAGSSGIFVGPYAHEGVQAPPMCFQTGAVHIVMPYLPDAIVQVTGYIQPGSQDAQLLRLLPASTWRVLHLVSLIPGKTIPASQAAAYFGLSQKEMEDHIKILRRHSLLIAQSPKTKKASYNLTGHGLVAAIGQGYLR